MNTQHTPGPWNVGDDSPNDYEGPIIDTRDRAVAVITIDHETESTPEDRANARLIASAPELLAALQQCADFILKVMDDPNLSDEESLSLLTDARNDARAAIIKATGKP